LSNAYVSIVVRVDPDGNILSAKPYTALTTAVRENPPPEGSRYDAVAYKIRVSGKKVFAEPDGSKLIFLREEVIRADYTVPEV